MEPVYVEEYMIAPAGVRFGNLFIDIMLQAVLAYVVGFISVVAGETDRKSTRLNSSHT